VQVKSVPTPQPARTASAAPVQAVVREVVNEPVSAPAVESSDAGTDSAASTEQEN
jgi:hypothetical protein